MPVETKDSARPSLLSRAQKALRGVETGSLRTYVLFLVLAAVGIFLLLRWWVTMVLAG